jgi:phosphohistidine phosphatase
MKKLFIIRHGKSDWSDDSLNDFDRPLNKRGFKNVPFMAKLLKKKDVKPDFILSSPAKRALETAQIIAKKVGYKKTISTNPDIYEAESKTLEKIIGDIDDKKKIVFLIGHNPGLSDLISILSKMDKDIPTCAVIEIDFDTNSWKKISKKNSKIISYEYPKKYE